MSTFTLAGNKYAIGLSWVEVEGKKIASKAEAIAKDTGKKFGVVYQEKGADSAQVGLTDDDKDKGSEAAASLFSQVSESNSAILIEKLSDDEFWICAISNRKIIIGGDQVLNHHDAQLHLNDLSSIYNEASEKAEIYINEKNLGVFSLLFSAENTILADFADLLASSKSRPLKKVKVKCLESNSRAAFLLLGFVASAAVMGYVLMTPEEVVVDDYFEPLPASAAQLREEEEREIARILQNAYNEEVMWLTESFEKKDPQFINEQVMQFSAQLPRFIGGWSASVITYSEDMPEFVSVRWEKEEGGTTLTLKNAIRGNVSFNLRGADAISQHKVISLSERKYDNLIDYIRGENYKHIEMMHDLESLKYTWKMDIHDSGPRNVKIQGIAGAQKSIERQLHVVAKDFMVSGEGLYSISNINFILDKATTSKINEITINLKDNYKWTINGVIYEN
jgi:hypothetical protein